MVEGPRPVPVVPACGYADSGTVIDSPVDPSESTSPPKNPRGGLRAAVHLGECLQLLRTFPPDSIDAVVTDPPYAIQAPATGGRGLTTSSSMTVDEEAALMGADMLGQHSANYNATETHSRGYADNDNVWFQRWCTLWLTECFRVLKPGGHLVAFGGTRSAHRLFTAAEDTGFEIRDQLLWLYGTGAPKSLNVGTAARAAAARGSFTTPPHDRLGVFDGWWTGIKPAHEPILLARKPLEGRVIDNVSTYGVGALNVAGCMISSADDGDQLELDLDDGAYGDDDGGLDGGVDRGESSSGSPKAARRWPSNLFTDHAAANYLDAVAGSPVSRYFWVAKPSRAERVQVDGVTHPTVKPLALLSQLVRLVTPPAGTVLDPFGGSGTTAEACLLEGFHSITIEREPGYIPLIQQRLDRRRSPLGAGSSSRDGGDLFSLLPDQPAPAE